MRRITKKKYLSDIAYEKIKDLIIRDQINKVMVTENELAVLLNMSRTPIRAALHRLELDKFVKVYPNKGVYIEGISSSEVNDLIEVRLAIELFSLKRIVDYISSEDYLYLEKKVVEQEYAANTTNIYEFIKKDLEYHEYLLSITGNENFIKELNNVVDRLFRHGLKFFTQDASRMELTIKEHKRINASLKGENFVAAYKHMENHLKNGTKLYLLI